MVNFDRISMQFRWHFWISRVKKHTLVNFQDQIVRPDWLFETEVIKEKVVFKMLAEAHQFAIH